MTVGVYGIFDRDTNTCLYVGMSANIEQRWKSHRKEIRGRRHRRKELVKWAEDFGFDSLVFKVLEECENDDKIKNALEIKWFNNLKPKFYGKKPSMNDTWIHSDETLKKIRESNIIRAEKMGSLEDKTCIECNGIFRIGKCYPYKRCKPCREMRKRTPSGERQPKKYEKTCEHCQQVFSTFQKRQLFCSHKCSTERNVIPIDKDELYNLYWVKNLSLEKISKIKGMNRQTVYNNLKRFGIPRRNKNDFHNL